MSRWKAASIHASISVMIGIVAAILIFGVWYAPPYSQATGAGELVMLLLGVDLVLGPLLTLVVFKSGKKGLRFDLCMIALAQLCAFSYGMSVVVRARPVFIVGAVDRFVLVLANDLDAADLANGRTPEFRKLPWTGPRIVGTEQPTDIEGSNALLQSGLAGKDIERFPKYYVDYSHSAAELLKSAKSIDSLELAHPDKRLILEDYMKSHQLAAANVLWLPIKAPRGDLTMLLERGSGKSLGVMQLDPW